MADSGDSLWTKIGQAASNVISGVGSWFTAPAETTAGINDKIMTPAAKAFVKFMKNITGGILGDLGLWEYITVALAGAVVVLMILRKLKI
jgi:hypothetical protein